jgi:iron complex transport system permease protein
MSNVKKVIYLFCLLFLLLFVSALSVTLGSFPITVTEVYSILWRGLFQNPETAGESIVWSLRLPRILMGIIAGISLGIAGSIMRGVLKNPLASPYTLGASSGAGFGAVLAIILGAGMIPMEGWYYLLIGIAFVFAFIVSLFILYLANRLGATPLGIVVVVMVGIAMIWLFTSMQSLILYFCDAETLRAASFWSIGGLERVSWDELVSTSVVLVICCILLLILLFILKLRDFDTIRVGADNSPFVKVKHIRTVLMAVATLLVASTVSFTGAIAFAGLVAPHIAYVTVGKENKFLLPASGLLGALFLVGSDSVARTIMAPAIIPVGVMTSLIGIPLFLYLLIKIAIRSTEAKTDESKK